MPDTLLVQRTTVRKSSRTKTTNHEGELSEIESTEQTTLKTKVRQQSRSPKPHRFVAGASKFDTDGTGDIHNNPFRGFVNLCNISLLVKMIWKTEIKE